MKTFEFPIRLDEATWRSNPPTLMDEITADDLTGDGWSFIAGPDQRVRVERSGYSADGVRLTNLTGVRDGILWKRCPNCGLRKPIQDFGIEGRMDGTRDQSHCSKCRGM